MKNNSKIRAAAYCRVSTLLEEQEGSYEIQMDYYRQRIENDPDMVLVGVYGDKGKSGMKTIGRSGLNELLKACDEGKIDLVLTKSVSRFARNMADCVEMIQHLNSIHVAIYFEKENLRTDDPKCALLLEIFAALAQEESNSISQNVRRSHEQHAAEGRPMGKASYGYVHSGEDRWQVNSDEAERVRLAFDMAAHGKNYKEILSALNQLEQEKHTGVVWLQKRVKMMLRNVVYMGDFYSHGTVCLTPGHQVINHGYTDRYYIEGHHEPLVTKSMFDRVQSVMEHGILQSYLPRTPERQAIINDMTWQQTA